MEKTLDQRAHEYARSIEVIVSDEEIRSAIRGYIAGATAERKRSEWISCKERLPTDYSLVLIVMTSGAITVGRRLRTNNWGIFTSTGMDIESMTNHVEYWQPLPSTESITPKGE